MARTTCMPPAHNVIGVDGIGAPSFDCSPGAGNFGVGELEIPCRCRERRIPDGALLPVNELVLHFDGSRLFGIERYPILYCPDRANRPYVCPLRTQERVQIQTLPASRPPWVRASSSWTGITGLPRRRC